MSESRAILLETAGRLFADIAKAPDEGFAVAWSKVEQSGLPSLLVPEAQGGFGGDWEDAFAIVRLAGAEAVPLPIGEAIAAAALNAAAGFDSQEGCAIIAPGIGGRLDAQGGFSGRIDSAPWGSDAAFVFASLNGEVIRLRVADALSCERGFNPAGEPRDWLTFENSQAQHAAQSADVFSYGALIRTAQIAGALDAALFMAISYANERVQFGKPIGKFQALQQSLALFAEEAAAVNCGGQAAARAADKDAAAFEIAAAKLRANIAAGIGAAVAHQVHGAIGFTQEFALHKLTRRLAAWRSEFGADRHWAERLGADVASCGPEGFWPHLTNRSDRS